MRINARFVNPFIQAGINVVQQIANKDVRRGHLSYKDQPEPSYGVCIIVGVYGFLKGQVVYSMKTEVAKRLVDKIRKNKDKIIETQEENLEDAEIVVISYGITSRVAIRGIEKARKYGIKVGSLRLITVWPFPDQMISELSKKVKGFVVPEINYGQIAYEVERCAHGNANVILVPHGGGSVHNPDDIFEAIKKAAKEKKKYDTLFEFETKLARLVSKEYKK